MRTRHLAICPCGEGSGRRRRKGRRKAQRHCIDSGSSNSSGIARHVESGNEGDDGAMDGAMDGGRDGDLESGGSRSSASSSSSRLRPWSSSGLESKRSPRRASTRPIDSSCVKRVCSRADARLPPVYVCAHVCMWAAHVSTARAEQASTYACRCMGACMYTHLES